MSGFRRTSAPVESFGIYDPEPDLDSGPDPVLDVESMMSTCSPLGRVVLVLVAVDGLSLSQVARRLRIPRDLASQAFDGASIAVAAECHRLGWGV